jgi:hypothetical protein
MREPVFVLAAAVVRERVAADLRHASVALLARCWRFFLFVLLMTCTDVMNQCVRKTSASAAGSISAPKEPRSGRRAAPAASTQARKAIAITRSLQCTTP